MLAEKRRKYILNLLKDHEIILVQDIIDRLNVAPITVRRDLTELEEQGMLIRTHGGAMKSDAATRLFSFDKRASLNKEKKEEICRFASGYVQDNDIIFIDCGSTIYRICKYIRNVKNLIIITNSLPVVSELINYTDIKINLVGGEIDQSRKATYGAAAEKFISEYHANKAFIGADGFSLEQGLTSYDEKESMITRRMAEASEEVFLLCDSTKIEKKSYLKFMPVSAIDHLVTDSDIKPEIFKLYRQNGINIITE